MAHRDGVVLDVDERPEFGQWVGLSLQHMFSMFGSTVLVPILVGWNLDVSADHASQDSGLYGFEL